MNCNAVALLRTLVIVIPFSLVVPSIPSERVGGCIAELTITPANDAANGLPP
jgi:hypothetical protein